MLCNLSHLDNAKIEEIKTLENELGKKILSFSCELEPADLSDEELGRVKELEDKLGVSLVAIN